MFNSKKTRLTLYISAFIVIALILFASLRESATLIPLHKAKELLRNNEVTKVIASKEFVYLKTKNGFYRIAHSQVKPSMFDDVKVEIESSSNIVNIVLITILALGLGSLGFRWYQKRYEEGENVLSTSNSTAPLGESTPVAPVKSNVAFGDVGGINEVKIELEEIIEFLRNPSRFKNFGAYLPRGVLLVGPPGVGKTMIAKAVAHEADVPFFYQSGASFVQIYVGMGAKRVHDLFQAAKNSAPAIIFIDEIDAVGKKREGTRNDEREATLNQLLTEMDGFEESSGIIVVAATNKIDVLDSALLRPGRFDRRIFVELPTLKERVSILSKYLQKIPHDVDEQKLAQITVGFSGAALAALVNEAALLSLRQKDMQVSMQHFLAVKDKVLFGKKSTPILSDEQRRYRVTYQAAKALSATYFDIAFDKVLLASESIKPTLSEPLLKHEIESRIKMLFSGIVASQLRFNEHATNAEKDLTQAKELIHAMVERFGMGSTLLRNEDDIAALYNTLYSQTQILVETLQEALVEIETVLHEKEVISKEKVSEILEKFS